jgi:hypothetical protein
MASKPKKIFMTTDFMPVIWAATNKAAKPYKEFNDKGEPNKPMFELKLGPTDEQVEAWVAKVKEAAGNFSFKTKKPKWGISVAEDEDETVTLHAKSQYKPTVVDAKNNPLLDPKIGKGSIVRAMVILNIYDKGVALTLQKIQIKKLVEYEASSGTDFDETDGYEAPEEQRGFPDAEEGTNGSSPLDL